VRSHVEFTILRGPQAGVVWTARRFPAQIGRSESDNFRLDAPGVWDRHAQVEFRPRDGFWLSARPEVTVEINGQPTREARLRNGDILDLGSARLQFWLGPMGQRGLAWREWLTWFGIAAVCLGQIALVYWLR